MFLTRLRWSAFGLRGRIVGAVVVTSALSLSAAALVLLPRLENTLKNATEKTLSKEVSANKGNIARVAGVRYYLIAEARAAATRDLRREGQRASLDLSNNLTDLKLRLGATNVTLIGYVDASGYGYVIAPLQSGDDEDLDTSQTTNSDVAQAYLSGRVVFSFGSTGSEPVVRALIPLGDKADAVLAVDKSIDEVPLAVKAVRHALEVGALVALLLTLGIAIPLAGTLVSRLQRLREAALRMAVGGNVADFPADRARDEVGDLARSFSIMQRRIRQQEEARRAFVATASHELRTPLASLNGMLELLADDIQADHVDLEDAAALLMRAQAQSRRLAQLAADLLDLSRIDADVSLRSEPIELGELGRAVLAEFELASTGRGVSVILEEQETPSWVLADPGSVARILRILLDNALRVAPRDTEIRVRVRATPEPMLVVSDSGPGVASEERALIFERFTRGRETGGEAGFGLGLAIGRELAGRMGGSLVLADTDGPGATFTLRLRPAQAPSADPVSSVAGV